VQHQLDVRAVDQQPQQRELEISRQRGDGADPQRLPAGGGVRLGELCTSVIRGRGILLLLGGMTIGGLATDSEWQQIQPFYEGLFRGMLMLFLVEMGINAARQAGAFRQVGIFMACFGAICASASFIDAPAACRASLPEANPGIYLTSSLAVTLPFNLLLGLPLYYKYAAWLQASVSSWLTNSH